MAWFESTRSRLKGLRSLSWLERRAFAWSLLMLPITRLGLRFSKLEKVQKWLTPRKPPSQGLSEEAVIGKATRLALAVRLAARHGLVDANCLPRSLVLWSLMRRHGITSDLRIGVAGANGTDRRFHAWVEYGGRVFNDAQDVAEQYRPFSGTVGPS